ncbi:MAG TPA: hypothetical protein VM347_07920 [Nonomuraea sp.]|nr:hypothetical protein [Nonomuraea sp.]
MALLREMPGPAGKTEVHHDGRILVEPYVATVHVVSRSALDIKLDTFGSQPLELEFGVPVVALLEKHSAPGRAAARDPEVKVAATAVHVVPALLTRRHELRYTVLLDGRPAFRPLVDLVDVTVHQNPPPALRGWDILRPLLLAFGVITAVLVPILFTSTSGQPLWPMVVVGALVLGVITTLLLAPALVFAMLTGARYRRKRMH